MYTRQHVKRLLQAGKSKSGIAQLLFLTKYRVDKIVKELIEAKRKRSKTSSKLKAYDNLIQSAICKGWKVKAIYANLCALNERVHYTTVAKYVRELKAAQGHNACPPVPGETAYLSLLRAGYGKKKKSYLFMMMLAHSRYSFLAPMEDVCAVSFFRTHEAAFRFFGGVAKTIKFCEVSSQGLPDSELESYQLFLAHYGVRLQEAAGKENICKENTQKVKGDILSELFHQDFKRFALALQRKYAKPFNLCLHPVTKKSIRKEFEQTEQSKLLPLPEQSFPLPIVAYRKVSKRGMVCYRYKTYKLPAQYKGQQIKVVEDGNQLRLLWEGKLMAVYSFQLNNKKQ